MEIKQIFLMLFLAFFFYMSYRHSKESKQYQEEQNLKKRVLLEEKNKKRAILHNEIQRLLDFLAAINESNEQVTQPLEKIFDCHQILQMLNITEGQYNLLNEIHDSQKSFATLDKLKTQLSSQEKRDADIVNIYGIDISEGMMTVKDVLMCERSDVALIDLKNKNLVVIHNQAPYEVTLTSRGRSMVLFINNFPRDPFKLVWLSNLGELRYALSNELTRLSLSYTEHWEDEEQDQAIPSNYKEINTALICDLLCENLTN